MLLNLPRLLDATRKISDPIVYVEAQGVTDATIRGPESGRFSIPGYPLKDFPQVMEQGAKVLKLSAADFTTLIERTVLAASTDDTRPTLTGVYVQITKQGVTASATDSYRLHRQVIERMGGKEWTGIVPGHMLKQALKAAKGADTVTFFGPIKDWPTRMSLMIEKAGKPSIRLHARCIDGQFPRVDQLIPDTFESSLIVPAEWLKKTAKSAEVALGGKRSTAPLRLIANAKRVTVQTHNPDNFKRIGYSESLRFTEEDDNGAFLRGGKRAVRMGLNPGFLADLMVGVEGLAILEYVTPLRPMMVHEDGYTGLIMPIRLSRLT
jgi:DNA polymerase-3 subunit beta